VGVFINLTNQDCPVYEPTLKILHCVATGFSFIWLVASIIGIYLSWKNLTVWPLTAITADKIMISFLIWQFLSTIFFACLACNYYVHTNYGIWALTSVYMDSFILYLYLAINFIVDVSYKLKRDRPPIVQITGIVSILCGLFCQFITLGLVITNNGPIQILLVRILLIVWVLTGSFFGVTIFYYGWKIEKLLSSGNEEENLKKIKAIRYVRNSFTIVLFLSMFFYVACLLLPILLLWVFPIGLSLSGAPFFIIWHTGIIRKKMGDSP